MKTVNQIVTLVVLVLLLVLLPVVATVPDAVLGTIQSAAASVEPWASTTSGRVVIGVVAALLWLAVVWLLWRSLRGRPDKTIRVEEVEEGRARVAEDSVAKLLEKRVAGVPDVKTVSAKVRRLDKEGVVAELTLTTVGEVRVPDVTRQVIEAARSALELEIGAKVARVDVRVKEVGTAAGVTMAPSVAAVTGGTQSPPVPTPAEPEPPSWTAAEGQEPTWSAEPEAPTWTESPSEPVVIADPEPPSWMSEPIGTGEEEFDGGLAELGQEPVDLSSSEVADLSTGYEDMTEVPVHDEAIEPVAEDSWRIETGDQSANPALTTEEDASLYAGRSGWEEDDGDVDEADTSGANPA